MWRVSILLELGLKPCLFFVRCLLPKRSTMSMFVQRNKPGQNHPDALYDASKRDMGTFVQRSNHITGHSVWEVMQEDYDYHQEVARAAYADMLHDTDRNKLYYAGLKAAIDAKHAAGEKAHVLDIGTGTGLLSMMAAKCGADTIVACEAFDPMAKCARQVIESNGLTDKICVVGKRSTELMVGEDLPHKANILVTEVFDTELIGEGALSTFNHAHAHLLECNSIVVPSSATVYAQLVDGLLFDNSHRLQPFRGNNGEILLKPTLDMMDCPGSSVVHDVQLSALTNEDFIPLAPPVTVFEFDWSKPNSPTDRKVSKLIHSQQEGIARAVLMWWDLKMDPKGEIVLSCAPSWTGNKAWRDHWIQAIYYFPQEIPVKANQKLNLQCSHDEYLMWFKLGSEAILTRPPHCKCGLHLSTPHSRLGNINDTTRRSKYLEALQRVITSDTVSLVSGDGTLLPSLVSKLGAKEVITTDKTRWTQSLIKHNDLKVKVVQDRSELVQSMVAKVTLLCSEPHYDTATLPWHNLAFWYLRSGLSLTPGTVIMPCAATIWAMPIELEYLWKIRAPLGNVEGFLMQPFDNLIETSSKISDGPVEPQPLWEYSNTCLGSPQKILNFDFSKSVSDKIEETCSLSFSWNGHCHGVALWMDWQLDKTTSVSSGPLVPPTPGHTVLWDKFSRQGLYLLRPYTKVSSYHKLHGSAKFDPDSGEINFYFELLQNSS